MNLEKSLAKLFSLHSFGIKLGLDNIKKFLNLLGNPQEQLKTFHIAGSNGKGSTAAFLASILQEFGYKVGLYTSPHFVRFNERIKISGVEIPDEDIASFIEKHEKFIEENGLTFFEATTAMAFDYFAKNKVDYAVIETGLGGRLDATNVLNPLAVIITSISYEHTDILGEKLEQIAAEKAGIIRNRTKVFIGKLPEEAQSIISERCKETNSELFNIEDYTVEKRNSLELYTEEIELDDWTMPLRGGYQKYNAALAGLVTAKTLDVRRFNIISAGIKSVIKNTGFQGRYEFYHSKPDIIFDSAHNSEGVQNFLYEFQKDSDKYSKKVLLFGVMRDKAVESMLKMLSKAFDEIRITQIEYVRVRSIEELQEVADKLSIKVIKETKPAEFVRLFKEHETDGCLVVLGSIYLVGAVKTELREYKNA
jgi:dihydrofolate synthase/folylpolyglutamate synthase